MAVFFCTAFGDYIWAKYITTVASSSKVYAANWSVLVWFVSAYVVIAYVEDKRMLIPVALGAWCGTYFGV